jgi:hypothetical protein
MTARPFMDVLREHRAGRTHDDLTEALHALNAAVAETGKGGTVTLVVKVAPHGDGAAMVTATVSSKLPKVQGGGAIFFLTPENNLERQDPRQHEMPLRAVPEAAAPRPIGAAG